MCLIAPFIEECIFRLPLLTKSHLLKWVISFIFILYFFSGSFQLDVSFWWYYAVLIIIFGGIIIFKNDDPQPIFGQKKYNYLCWILTISFAMLHVTNFLPLQGDVFYLYPLYVLPQFVRGAVQSYLTIKYKSILWPFFLHACINATSELSRLVTAAF
ncbi:type II CAAX prenyl endopeptidase Rce1 family protein [Dyadobacter sp. CY345]|uniref:CPBP family glutamic-type intramembrane protease n=1 Tax=Dyadobacter sp. CY345 TaxID=2909335 RepID=UPI0038D45890